MTDNHPHMPAIKPTGARWLSPGKVMVVINGTAYVMTWEEAKDLAEAICESLQLEVRF